MNTRRNVIVTTIAALAMLVLSLYGQEETPIQDPYKLRIGDTLDVSILGESDASRQVRVLPDGSIAYLYDIRVPAAGLTLAELNKQLTERLRILFRAPFVSIIPVKLVGESSAVIIRGGGVRSPQTFPISGGERLLTIIVRAGDLRYDTANNLQADLPRSRVFRDGKVLDVDFEALLFRMDESQNIALQGGDIVYIPDLARQFVTLVGVEGSTQLEFETDMRLLDALSKIGWLRFSDDGTYPTDLTRAFIIRDGKQLETTDFRKLILEHDLQYNTLLQDGDFIHVPDNYGTASIIGVVHRPGIYELSATDTILSLIAKAKGLVYGQAYELLVDTGRAYLSRGGVHLELDFGAILNKDDRAADVRVIAGDLLVFPPATAAREGTASVIGGVRKPGRIVLHGGDKLFDLITKAGGTDLDDRNIPDIDFERAYLLRDETEIEIDLEALMVKGDLAYNIPVQDGDFLYVPKRIQFGSIIVIGPVTNPGHHVIRRGDRVLDGMAMAGWTLASDDAAVLRGDLQSAVLRRGKEILDIDFSMLFEDESQNIEMQDGDVIYVPEAALKKIYVFGEVRSPKSIPFTRPISLVEALTEAGGVTAKATLHGQVLIVRGTLDEPTYIEKDLHKLVRAKNVENMMLESGDIVFVPEAKLSIIERYVGYLQSLVSFALSLNNLNNTVINPR